MIDEDGEIIDEGGFEGKISEEELEGSGAAAVEASFGVGHMLDGDAAASETIDIVHGDLRLTVCAPSAGEIAALTRQYGGDGDADIESVRRALLQSCVVRCQTASGKAADLPEDADAAVAAAVETLDPLAAIALTLTCPHCNAAFETPFDPTDFVWRELATAANRLLWEVDQLARAYSWPEADILALSPTRRRAYLEIAAG